MGGISRYSERRGQSDKTQKDRLIRKLSVDPRITLYEVPDAQELQRPKKGGASVGQAEEH
jgi:hypothetical protein